MITIVDFGIGNLGSIQNMIKKIGYRAIISRNPEEITNAEKIILPGVGSFDVGMKKIEEHSLKDILEEYRKSGKFILGICLGMQLMTKGSDEGQMPGLGWINAKVKKFSFEDKSLKIPHMGWNLINQKKKSAIFNEFSKEIRAYFVHSYYVECYQNSDVLSGTTYGHEFVSAYEHENIIGMQFHPEKSHKYGMKLLKNFIEL